MPESSDPSSEQSLDRLRRLVAMCEEFDDSLRNGGTPRIDEYLDRVPGAEREHLRAELMEMERTFAGGGAESAFAGDSTVWRDAGDGGGDREYTDTRTTPPIVASRPLRPGPLRPGEMLGRYEIIEEIGRGGMAVVYRGLDTRMSKVVALKVLPPSVISDEAVLRFDREMKAYGRLEHPDIVPILNVGEDRGLHYIVMSYLSGGSLSDRLREAPMADRPAAALMARVARAVHYSHGKGLIHRDLKPSNILLDGAGKPYVSDFGLVKFLGVDPDLTLTGPLLGTIPYMSPEQALAPEGVKEAADIYGLGATLYAALVGRPPFRAADPVETLRQVRDEPPPPPRKQNPSISRDLETICLKCLEKSSERRFATALEFAEELERFVRNEPIRTRPPGWPGRLGRWVARKPAVAALLGGVLAMAAVSFLTITLLWIQADARRRDLRLDSYYSGVTLAAQALSAHRTDQAETFLHDCPVDLRGWEWRVLERLRNEPALVLKGERAALFGVDFAPDSRRLVSVGRRGQARVWDLLPGRAGRALPGLPAHEEIADVAWVAPGGRSEYIAVACRDGLVHLWEPNGDGWTTRALARVHAGGVTRLAVDADGARLLSCGDDGRVVLWDVASGQSKELMHLRGRIEAVAISADGRDFAGAGTDRLVRVGRCDGGNARIVGELSGVGMDLAFSSDGRLLASGAEDGTVALWDLGGLGRGGVLGSHREGVNALAFCPEGGRLASAGSDGFVRIWDTIHGREAVSLEAPAGVEALAFNRDGERLAAACRNGSTIVWNAEPLAMSQTPKPQILRGHQGTLWTLAVSPDGQRVAAAGEDGLIYLWKVAGGAMTAFDPGARRRLKVNAVAFRRDGRQLAAAGRDEVVTLWDVDSGAHVSVEGGCRRIGGLAYSPDGRAVAFGGEPLVRLWSPERGGRPRTLGRHTEEVLAVAYAPGGDLIATGGADCAIRLWGANGEDRGALLGHNDFVEDLAFSPDGRFLASAGGDRVVILWEVATGKVLQRLEGHASRVWGVSFSPDGRLVATAGGDKVVRVWDVATGEKTVELRGHEGAVLAVAFSPDGRFLGSAGSDSTVRLWAAKAWDGSARDD